MATPRTRLSPAARRESILAAARAVFIANDYADASMEAVAKQAGVTTGLVNHYFGTKRGLYLAVIEDLAAGLPAMVRADTEDLPLREMVDRNMSGFLDAFERNEEAWSMLLGAQGGAGRDPAITAIVSRARDATVMRMAANHAGDEPSEELLLALRAFQGAAETAAIEWLRRGRATREQVHELLTRTLISMVGEHTRK
jgi:AcrR family transcriptional regulator